jgi:hypothetical protein
MTKTTVKSNKVLSGSARIYAKRVTIAAVANLHDTERSSSWPFRPEDISPLAWWRTMPADRLRDAEHLILRDTLSKIGVLWGCEWVNAMRGDAGASIAIAVELLPITEFTLQVDLAMSALLLNALGGNRAAALMLSHMLRKTELAHPCAPQLAGSWLASNLRAALKTDRALPKAAITRDTAALPPGMGA